MKRIIVIGAVLFAVGFMMSIGWSLIYLAQVNDVDAKTDAKIEYLVAHYDEMGPMDYDYDYSDVIPAPTAIISLAGTFLMIIGMCILFWEMFPECNHVMEMR